MKHLKLITALSLALLSSTSLYADTIFVDGKQIPVESELKRSTTYVPLRFIAEALGGTVEWQSPHAIVKKGDMTIQFTINSHDIVVNGEQHAIATVPYLSNNYTYVPLRFISEQLGCDITYNKDKTVHITNHNGPYTPPPIPEYVDTNHYSLSANQLWGVTQDKIFDEKILSIKNMETGITKDLFTGFCSISTAWVNNLLLIDYDDELLLYNPETETFETLIKDFSGIYVSMPDLNAVLYITGGYVDLSTAQYYIYPIEDKKPEKITRERCHELLEKYAPEYITKGYMLSKNKRWGVTTERLIGSNTYNVILKDMTNYKIKKIFTSDNDSSIKWLNNNLLIDNSAVEHNKYLYNPQTDQLQFMFKGGFEEIFIEDLNAFLYLKDNGILRFFIYYFDTGKSEEISRDEFHNLQEKYFGYIAFHISEEANYAY